MADTKWTKGPWRNYDRKITTSRGIIANCPTPQDFGVFDCNENAHLIAAAPDLYEALAKIVFDWDGEPDDLADAQAALRKARGDPS